MRREIPGQHHEPVGERLPLLDSLHLLLGDRPPQVVDDLRGVAVDVACLEMLPPEPQARLPRDLLVERHDVHLGVVEHRPLVEVRRSDGQPAIVDDADLRVDVDEVAERRPCAR